MRKERNDDEEEHNHAHYHGVDRAEMHIGVDQALARLLSEIRPVKSELVDLLPNLINRTIAEDVISKFNIPKHSRSTRDGYAVRIDSDVPNPSSSTFKIIGDVRIGIIPD